jgi:isopenicillin-N epimerase
MHHVQGTRDPAAYLSVPAAIAFQRNHDWEAVRSHSHALAAQTVNDVSALTGLPPIADEIWFGQMAAIPLPPCDESEIQRRLYDEYRIEVPILNWRNGQYIRVSIQGYNTAEDVECLKAALVEVLSLERS